MKKVSVQDQVGNGTNRSSKIRGISETIWNSIRSIDEVPFEPVHGSLVTLLKIIAMISVFVAQLIDHILTI